MSISRAASSTGKSAAIFTASNGRRPGRMTDITTDLPQDKSFWGHPKGLGYIVFTEAWERFSFYGMQALLVLYMAGHLFKPEFAEKVLGFGAFRSAVEGVFGPLSVQALASQV